MSIKYRIRNWLGITILREEIHTSEIAIRDLKLQLKKREENDIVLRMAMARIIAKIEPMYSVPEIDPDRKAASDKIAEEVLTKMHGEVLAAKHSTGD